MLIYLKPYDKNTGIKQKKCTFHYKGRCTRVVPRSNDDIKNLIMWPTDDAILNFKYRTLSGSLLSICREIRRDRLSSDRRFRNILKSKIKINHLFLTDSRAFIF